MKHRLGPADYHFFEDGGQEYAFLPLSFVVLEVDRVFKDVIRHSHLRASKLRGVLAERHDPRVVDEAIAELESLWRRGLVGPPDKKPRRKKRFDVQNILLMVTNACNFSCKYCHGDHEKLAQEHMTEETARRAVDLLIDRSGAAKNVSIYFFGGEPLLNFPVVESTVEYATKRGAECGKQVSFGMTTNAYLLDRDKAAFLNEHDFSPLFSMDGPAEVQNACRQLRGGQSTFDAVYANVKHYVELGGPCSVRATVTPASMDLVRIAGFFYETGFRSVNLEPVSTPASSSDSRFDLDWEALKTSYTDLAESTMARLAEGDTRWNVLVRMIERVHEGTGHHKPCYVGEENLTVTAEGDIYPCYRFVGKRGFRMGSLEDGVDLKVSRRFDKQNNIFASEDCLSCWARYMCHGQCPADCLEKRGDLMSPVPEKCNLEKHLITLALELYVRIRRDDKLSEQCFRAPAHTPLPDAACV